MKTREKYVRSFYEHPEYGTLLPLADNDPLLYEMGPVLVIDAKNRDQRMFFTCLKDWERQFVYSGKARYKNTHKDHDAPYKRSNYKLAYFKWEPDPDLACIHLNDPYPIMD